MGNMKQIEKFGFYAPDAIWLFKNKNNIEFLNYKVDKRKLQKILE